VEANISHDNSLVALDLALSNLYGSSDRSHHSDKVKGSVVPVTESRLQSPTVNRGLILKLDTPMDLDVLEPAPAPLPVAFFESPLRYDAIQATRMLLNIGQASTALDPMSCLISLTPFESGSVQICHLVDKESSDSKVNNFLLK